MQLTSFYPVVCTADLLAARDFYTTYLDFRPTFESDWYISLKRRSEPQYELALLDATHPTIPEAFRKPVQGLLLNFEVEDVDAQYTRLVKVAGLPVALDLRDEDFGQRHFIIVDPAGVLIDMIQVIPPAAEFADQYRE
jgi:catechol 2,3-dioxygenase-like lactoylglutathione lyase family enzyme